MSRVNGTEYVRRRSISGRNSMHGVAIASVWVTDVDIASSNDDSVLKPFDARDVVLDV